jgi:hypothetical protein
MTTRFCILLLSLLFATYSPAQAPEGCAGNCKLMLYLDVDSPISVTFLAGNGTVDGYCQGTTSPCTANGCQLAVFKYTVTALQTVKLKYRAGSASGPEVYSTQKIPAGTTVDFTIGEDSDPQAKLDCAWFAPGRLPPIFPLVMRADGLQHYASLECTRCKTF